MPLPIEHSLSRFNPSRLSFAYPKVAASLAATAMNVFASDATSGALGVTVFKQPWAGQIVAVSVDLAAAVTAGTLTLTPTINGVAISAAGYIQIFNAAGQDVVIPNPVVYPGVAFNAGDKLGCNIASNGSLLPTGTDDVFVNIYVLWDIPLL